MYSNSSLNGTMTVNAGQKIKAPVLDRAFYQASQVAANQAALTAIKGTYHAEIANAATVTGLPIDLIATFIFIESSGKNVVRTSGNGPTGLMQISPSTATVILMTEFKEKRMTPAKKVLLENALGKTRLACVAGQKWQNQKTKCAPTGMVVTAKDLSKPGVNILIGSLYLRWLVDQHTEGTTVRLDKIVIRYNAGHNYKLPEGGTANEVYNLAMRRGGKESGNYIAKLVGKNGLIEMLT